MTVLRIVADLTTQDVASTAAFYIELFGLSPQMDFGWITTLSSNQTADVQISIASDGGSGTPVPHLSIEVDNLDEVFATAQKIGAEIAYPMTQEPWGVRRFFLRDPDGRLVNVLSHQS